MITSIASGSIFFPASTFIMSLILPLISTITKRIQNELIISAVIFAPVFEFSFSLATSQAKANEPLAVIIGIAYDHSFGLSKNQLQNIRITTTETT